MLHTNTLLDTSKRTDKNHPKNPTRAKSRNIETLKEKKKKKDKLHLKSTLTVSSVQTPPHQQPKLEGKEAKHRKPTSQTSFSAPKNSTFRLIKEKQRWVLQDLLKCNE